MDIINRVVVVTGGGRGIGASLARSFASEGAAGVVVADIDGAAATSVAAEIGGLGVHTDVSVEADIRALVNRTIDRYGRVDIFCSNAGIGPAGGVDMSNADWQRAWDINVMAHVYAARAVLPGMLERREGYLVQTASAAGLLTNIGAAAYSVTKHAVMALAEWLSVTYGDQGIRVSALCPQFVNTDLLADLATEPAVKEWVSTTTIEPDAVADAVVAGIRDERFLILPHPEVEGYFQRKAADYDRWLSGMRRLQESVLGPGMPPQS